MFLVKFDNGHERKCYLKKTKKKDSLLFSTDIPVSKQFSSEGTEKEYESNSCWVFILPLAVEDFVVVFVIKIECLFGRSKVFCFYLFLMFPIVSPPLFSKGGTFFVNSLWDLVKVNLSVQVECSCETCRFTPTNVIRNMCKSIQEVSHCSRISQHQ